MDSVGGKQHSNWLFSVCVCVCMYERKRAHAQVNMCVHRGPHALNILDSVGTAGAWTASHVVSETSNNPSVLFYFVIMACQILFWYLF